MTMSKTKEYMDLAARIKDVPSYDGEALRASLYRVDKGEHTAVKNVSVFLVAEESRALILAALDTAAKEATS